MSHESGERFRTLEKSDKDGSLVVRGLLHFAVNLLNLLIVTVVSGCSHLPTDGST